MAGPLVLCAEPGALFAATISYALFIPLSLNAEDRKFPAHPRQNGTHKMVTYMTATEEFLPSAQTPYGSTTAVEGPDEPRKD